MRQEQIPTASDTNTVGLSLNTACRSVGWKEWIGSVSGQKIWAHWSFGTLSSGFVHRPNLGGAGRGLGWVPFHLSYISEGYGKCPSTQVRLE